MNTLTRLFYYVNYFLLIASPRTLDLTERQNASRGELAGLPLFVVMLVEFLIRVALILLLATLTEAIVGDELYESYYLDLGFQVLVVAGAVHSFFYCLLLGYLRKRLGFVSATRWYRLARNLCYATLPGLLAAGLLIIWREQQEIAFIEGLLPTEIYWLTTMVMAACGLFEAWIVKRKPLGLDHSLHAGLD